MMDKYFSATPERDVALSHDDTDTFEQARREAALDEALRCTFPASDPVALNTVFASLAVINPEQHRLITGLSQYPPLRKQS
jgi:hypothetical protein